MQTILQIYQDLLAGKQKRQKTSELAAELLQRHRSGEPIDNSQNDLARAVDALIYLSEVDCKDDKGKHKEKMADVKGWHDFLDKHWSHKPGQESRFVRNGDSWEWNDLHFTYCKAYKKMDLAPESFAFYAEAGSQFHHQKLFLLDELEKAASQQSKGLVQLLVDSGIPSHLLPTRVMGEEVPQWIKPTEWVGLDIITHTLSKQSYETSLYVEDLGASADNKALSTLSEKAKVANHLFLPLQREKHRLIEILSSAREQAQRPITKLAENLGVCREDILQTELYLKNGRMPDAVGFPTLDFLARALMHLRFGVRIVNRVHGKIVVHPTTHPSINSTASV